MMYKPDVRFMEIEDSEKHLYFTRLQSIYGWEILTDEAFLDARSQGDFERMRHAFNSRFLVSGLPTDPYPKRLLLSVTQKCTSRCAHCWVFGSPAAKSELGIAQLREIRKNLLDGTHDTFPDLTVSGGEFFILPDFSEILAEFPIQCVYSNAFWGYPENRCAEYIMIIKESLAKNSLIDKSRLTFILSYDRFHIQGQDQGSHLADSIARIIDCAYLELPEITFRISHIADCPEPSFLPVIKALEGQGFEIAQTARDDRNGMIKTVSFLYNKSGGPNKELFVDSFPMTPVCRGLLLENSTADDRERRSRLSENKPLSRYQYTVGPDGGLGLYEILYAPPVPYCAGNLVREPWEQIEERILRDPVAVALRNPGAGIFDDFMERYHNRIHAKIVNHTLTIQQFLYLILLDPGCRLFLNLFLFMELNERGLMEEAEKGLQERIKAFVESRKTVPGMDELTKFYSSVMM